MTTTQINSKINVRVLLIDSITNKGIQNYGGEGNATVSNPSFRINAGLRANYLVNGLDQFRKCR